MSAKSDAARRAAAAKRRRIREARLGLNFVHVPGRDPEPQVRAELIGRDGTVWRKGTETGSGWVPEDEPDLELKWTSPAMSFAGPFAGPRIRSREKLAADRRKAARGRWDQYRARLADQTPVAE